MYSEWQSKKKRICSYQRVAVLNKQHRLIKTAEKPVVNYVVNSLISQCIRWPIKKKKKRKSDGFKERRKEKKEDKKIKDFFFSNQFKRSKLPDNKAELLVKMTKSTKFVHYQCHHLKKNHPLLIDLTYNLQIMIHVPHTHTPID